MTAPVPATPTFASLERTRARQRAMLGLLRPLGFLVVVLVEVGGARAHPRPGLGGERLGILIALVGFAVGVAGVIRSRNAPPTAQAPFFAVLVLSSATLDWLQPNGPAFVGAFVAVSAAAMRVRGVPGASIALLALLALPVAGAFGKDRSPTRIALAETGVLAFYIVALLANRLREGQEQAERLLIELDRSREAQAQAAVLAERQRLAREMHDVLAHTLAGLALQLEGARLVAQGKRADAEIVEALERAHHLAKGGIDEARRAIAMLRDDELPGPERLAALAAAFERDAGVPTSITVTGEEHPLDSEARLTLYRTAQEALTNVRKHARSERVELRLDYESAGARLTVEDFGASIDGGSTGDGSGYGLTGMRERAELLGGTLAAGPTAAGFRVELWVPA